MGEATKSYKPNNNGEKQTHERTHKAPSWVVLKILSPCRYCHVSEGKKEEEKKKDIEEKKDNLGAKIMVKGPGTNCSNRYLKGPCDEAINNGGASTCSSFNSSSASASASASVTSASSSSLSSSFSSLGGSFRGVHMKKLSGCYECHLEADTFNCVSKDHAKITTICSCNECGEVFINPEDLEIHQANNHAVSELGAEDSSRSIVEIIFQSSWLNIQHPMCKIDRILKVNNSPKTTVKFEEYRNNIKGKAIKLSEKYPRFAADGNELLRFHCTTLACSLGLDGSTNLCHSIDRCDVCEIIRHGFRFDELGRITLSSRAREISPISCGGEAKRAMFVCRVIAGRVKKSNCSTVWECESIITSPEDFDSMVGSNSEELIVFNPRAILPCFVVIYGFC
uniref:C2H2-type domain-containing protein n=1 Tax=Ananas comosus var. bracteatus TaxID=296719 RepID=A0A6V7Q1F6_ANACO|nr:unnamed protein product [Ananas comosus var. bracteatus]